MKIPFRLVLAHAGRTWLRTGLTIVSVFVAVVIVGFLQAFLATMNEVLDAASPSRLATSSALSLFAHLPKRLEPELKATEHVKALTHWTWFGGLYIDQDSKHFWARFGVDAPTMREVYGSEMILGDAEWEEFIRTRTGCIVGRELAKREKFRVGDVIPLTGNLFLGRLELQVVGIYGSRSRAFDESTLFMHWDYMNEVSKQEGGRHDVVSVYSLLLDDPRYGAAVAEAIDSAYENSENRTRTLTERAFQQQFNSMWGNLPSFFAVLGSVVLVACLMVTANTMVLNARERVQEVGVLKTLGFTPADVAAMTLIEGMVFCLVGGLLALAVISLMHDQMVMFMPLTVPPKTLATAFGLSIGLGLFSGAIPAFIASRMNIIQAVRRRA